jgi:hypothetical protein
MKNKTMAITLVRNGSILYPYTEADYETLRALRCPITDLATDYLPLLSAYARRHGHKTQVVPFEPIEQEMYATKVAPKWKHGLSVTPKEVVLTYTKDEPEERVDKLQEALKRWYKRHYITFDVNVRRTAKKITVTMKKVYGHGQSKS